ncbi:hypothetical protein SERLA73DRAFT_75475 [Serpula lacrymans var. lacrymans S7.3]|uniref:Uncharacterized protein n=1 Tax=Serpula lacrymans var. lacrymans (strain S7.3) TaxID=936435 RepID=F8Q4W2_SERL3|nr:hypothetical protein SERLA73DRAFT_75475 [Serpula lacrymans var. lacrymans S7.3]
MSATTTLCGGGHPTAPMFINFHSTLPWRQEHSKQNSRVPSRPRLLPISDAVGLLYILTVGNGPSLRGGNTYFADRKLSSRVFRRRVVSIYGSFVRAISILGVIRQDTGCLDTAAHSLAYLSLYHLWRNPPTLPYRTLLNLLIRTSKNSPFPSSHKRASARDRHQSRHY